MAEETDAERWDSFLANQPGVPPLSRFGWGRILTNTLHTRPVRLIAETADGKIAGTLFGYPSVGGDGLPRLYSLNRGFVVRSPTAEAALLRSFGELQTDYGAAEAEISCAYEPSDAVTAGPERHSIVMQLAANEDDTWKGLRAKTRNMIRKAEKNSVSIESGLQHLDVFYDIYAERMLELNVAIYGRELFHAIASSFTDDVELLVARRDGVMIGGLFLIFGTDTAIYPAQATQTTQMDSAATQLLIWAAAQRCIARRVYRLDMGESRPDSPVYRSKLNFGGTPEPSYRLSLHQSAAPSRRASLRRRVLTHLFNRILQEGPDWARRQAGLRLKRQGRLLF